MAIQWNTGSAQIGALPTADATQEGKIFQYTGETNSSFTNGYFYKCDYGEGTNYEWQRVNVQPATGGGDVYQYSVDSTDPNFQPISGQTDVYSMTIPDIDWDEIWAAKNAGKVVVVRVEKLYDQTYGDDGLVVPMTFSDVTSSPYGSGFGYYMEEPGGLSENRLVVVTLQKTSSAATIYLQYFTVDGGGTIDTAMSDTSENAVQNKVIKAAIDEKAMNPTGWGVAKVGTVTLTGTGIQTVDISELNFQSVDDYAVYATVQDTTTTAMVPKITDKTTTSFSIRKTGTGNNIPCSYVVIGKGYGGGSAIRDLIPDTVMSDTSENAVENKVIKAYVDGLVSVDSALDLTSEHAVQNKVITQKVNDLQSAIDNIAEPFRVKQWADNTLSVTIPTCTTDIANTGIQKMEFTIDDVEGADYQIVGMIAYEVFDEDGSRINCWPVCQFTGGGQKILTVRWMCGGTTNKVAKKISAWVLLKHR